jgi:hypothetical protein
LQTGNRRFREFSKAPIAGLPTALAEAVNFTSGYRVITALLCVPFYTASNIVRQFEGFGSNSQHLPENLFFSICLRISFSA